MKLYQSDLELIQRKTRKEYDVDYSNNAESEYVKIYDENTIKSIIYDLLDYVDEIERELDHKIEELEEFIEDRDDNWTRKPVDYGVSDKDFI